MLTYNKNLNNQNLNNQNFNGSDSPGSMNNNSDGLLSFALKDLNEIELAIPVSSTHTSASAPPLQQVSILNSYVSASAFNEKILVIREGFNGMFNKIKKIDSKRKRWILFLIVFGLGITALAVYNSYRINSSNSTNNTTDDSVVTTGSSGNDVNHGHDDKDGLPVRDGVDGLPGNNGINGINGINGTNGINGINGINGSTPKLFVRGDILYTNNNKEVLNLYTLFKNFTERHSNIFNDNSDYAHLDNAAGSTYIGRSFDPIRDSHGASLFVETFEKGNIFTNPITNKEYKIPDYIGNYDHNHQTGLVASTELFESTTEYQKGKASEVGISGGYGGMFEASASSGERSIMTTLSQEDTAVTQSILYQKTYEAKAEQVLIPYVKPEFTLAANALPEFPDIFSGTNNTSGLKGGRDVLSKEEIDLIRIFDEFSSTWNDFFVTAVDLGGSITKQTEISNFSELLKKYSRSVLKASVGGGWGPFSAEVGVSNTIERGSAVEEVNENSKESCFVTSGDGVGDLEDSSSVITNLNDWGDEQMQSHLDRSRKSPVVVAEKVMPVYFLMEDEAKERYRKYLEWKYGTESESLADIADKFNKELSKTKDAFKKSEGELRDKILDIIPSTSSNIVFGNCRWVDIKDDIDYLETVCDGKNEVPKSLQFSNMHHNYGRHIHHVKCCSIGSYLS